MNVGDFIRYRDRISSDPMPRYDWSDGWGATGIVVKICEAVFTGGNLESAVEYLDADGHFHLARTKDVEVISTALEEEEAMWKIWGEI